MSLENIQAQAESAPSSVINGTPPELRPPGGQNEASSWEPSNIICSGYGNGIDNSRRCSVINGYQAGIGSPFGYNRSQKRENGKFNCHSIGDRYVSSRLDNTFYVGSELTVSSGWEIFTERSVFVTGDVISTYAPSDSRLKNNVIQISNRDASNLKPVSFTWRKDGSEDIGFIAQDVQLVFPEAVQERKNGFLGVQYHKLAIALISSIQEKQKRIDKLKDQISKLK